MKKFLKHNAQTKMSMKMVDLKCNFAYFRVYICKVLQI